MSGGSWDYFTFKCTEIADRLCDPNNAPLRRAFGEHMHKIAHVMYVIEWVDSGDRSYPEDRKALEDFFGEQHKAIALDQLLKDARKLIEELQNYTDGNSAK